MYYVVIFLEFAVVWLNFSAKPRLCIFILERKPIRKKKMVPSLTSSPHRYQFQPR